MAMIKVDINGSRFTVGSPPKPKNDMEGRQRQDRVTGTPLFTTQLVKVDEEGAEIVAVTTPGAPQFAQGAEVRPVSLVAIPWQQGQRSGVAFKADAIEPAQRSGAVVEGVLTHPAGGDGSGRTSPAPRPLPGPSSRSSVRSPGRRH